MVPPEVFVVQLEFNELPEKSSKKSKVVFPLLREEADGLP